MKDKNESKYFSVQKQKISEDYAGSRLDNFLISSISELPRSKIYSIIRKGEVRINGSRSKAHTRLKKGDLVRIPPFFVNKKRASRASQKIIDLLKKSIVYNQKGILVLNKPHGLASHGGSGINIGLIEAVRQIDVRFKDAQLVHRLDRDTSGCIVLALKRSSLRSLNEELREGRVEKKYLAVVKGSWPYKQKLISSYLKKNQLRSGEREVRINPKGKESKTNFKKIKDNLTISLLMCEMITGRTHQLRVQTSNEGHPIIGDKKYGDSEINTLYKKKGIKRMLLHAKSINFKELNFSIETNEPKIFKEIFD